MYIDVVSTFKMILNVTYKYNVYVFLKIYSELIKLIQNLMSTRKKNHS